MKEEVPKSKEFSFTLNDFPWDILELILRYTPRIPTYPILRGLNRQFYQLITKKKVGLSFAKGDVTSKMFYDLISKSRGSITHFAIKCR